MPGTEIRTKDADLKAIKDVTKEGGPEIDVGKLGVEDDTKGIKSQRRKQAIRKS